MEGLVARIVADFVEADGAVGVTEAVGARAAGEAGVGGAGEAGVGGAGAGAGEAGASRQRCWIADLDGAPVGSVMCARQDDETARLRCLLVDPSARGLGAGRRLVTECVAFARAQGYRRMVLTTVDLLHGARRLYEEAGFELESSRPGPLFGCDLTIQDWSLEL
jgi:GNAT superfamily N-acetyltransferase